MGAKAMTKQAILQDPMFHDEDKAREALEAELWPDGPVCRHCGNADPDKIAKVQGKKQSHRAGLYYCNECKSQFTVTVGTVLERSKVPLTKWLIAAHMFNSGKNGVSAHEIHRSLGVTYKTAWFMMHRLREAMDELNPPTMGGEGKSIQADETYYGNSSKRSKSYRKGLSHKASVVALVIRWNISVHGMPSRGWHCRWPYVATARPSYPHRQARSYSLALSCLGRSQSKELGSTCLNNQYEILSNKATMRSRNGRVMLVYPFDWAVCFLCALFFFSCRSSYPHEVSAASARVRPLDV